VVLVTSPSKGHHDEGSEDVRWSDEAVGCGGAESHSVLQNDGQEVRDGVCNGRCHHEDNCEAKDLEIERAFEVFGQVEFLRDDIMAIFLDTCDNEVDFWLGQELLLGFGGLRGELREVDDEVPTDQADDNGNHSLEYEYPPPPSYSCAKVWDDLRVLLGGACILLCQFDTHVDEHLLLTEVLS
jgi:hypothetical protein